MPFPRPRGQHHGFWGPAVPAVLVTESAFLLRGVGPVHSAGRLHVCSRGPCAPRDRVVRSSSDLEEEGHGPLPALVSAAPFRRASSLARIVAPLTCVKRFSLPWVPERIGRFPCRYAAGAHDRGGGGSRAEGVVAAGAWGGGSAGECGGACDLCPLVLGSWAHLASYG